MLSIFCGKLTLLDEILNLTPLFLWKSNNGMKGPNLSRIDSFVLVVLFFCVAVATTSCQTTADPADVSYRQPVSPIDGAVMMQDRLGQITRSNIR